MKNHLEQLRLQGKEKMIEQAVALLEEKHPALDPDYSDYEITVWTNSTTVLIKFRYLFRIYSAAVAGNSSPVCDLTVDLMSGEIYPLDDWFAKDRFHYLTSNEKEILRFVKENTDLPYEVKRNYTYEIHDMEGYYTIYIRMNGSFTNYRIDKITGEQSGYNELNANPALLPEMDTGNPDPLTELH